MPNDFTDVLFSDEPTAQEKLRALVAGLRGQQAYGQLGQLTGDRVLAPFGQSLASNAQQQIDTAQHLPGERLKMAAGKLKLSQEQADSAALGGKSPAGAEAIAKLRAVKQMQPLPMGTTTLYSPQTGKTVPVEGGGIDSLLSPEAIDQNARAYLTQGPSALPNMGKANPLVHGAIIRRAAEMNPGADLSGNKADYKADTDSLRGQQKMLDNAESWESTGKKNLGVLLGVAQKLKDTGSPWLNGPVRAFMEKGAGDPNQAAFKTAHAAVVNEYAKILSGASGNAGVTDAARKEADSMLPLDATWEQLQAAANVLDTDAANRIGSARQQVQAIRGRMKGGGGQSGATPAAAPATAPVRRFQRDASGKLVEVKT